LFYPSHPQSWGENRFADQIDGKTFMSKEYQTAVSTLLTETTIIKRNGLAEVLQELL
jgi:hypothetical protein